MPRDSMRLRMSDGGQAFDQIQALESMLRAIHLIYNSRWTANALGAVRPRFLTGL